MQGALPSALKSSITVAIGVFQALKGERELDRPIAPLTNSTFEEQDLEDSVQVVLTKREIEERRQV